VSHEAQVEAVARALADHVWPDESWEGSDCINRIEFREQARVAIHAMSETP